MHSDQSAAMADVHVKEIEAILLRDQHPSHSLGVKRNPDGGIIELRWPSRWDGSRVAAKIAKKHGAKWIGRKVWKFYDQASADAALPQIQAALPGLPRVEFNARAINAHPLKGVCFKHMQVSRRRAALFLPHRLHMDASLPAALMGRLVRCFKVHCGSQPETLLVIVGTLRSIRRISDSFQKQGATLQAALNTSVLTLMCGRSSVAKAEVFDWTVNLQLDVLNPAYLSFLPDLLKRGSLDRLQRSQSSASEHSGAFSVSVQTWVRLQQRFAEEGLLVEEVIMDTQQGSALDPSAVPGWENPAPCGLYLKQHQKEALSFIAEKGYRAILGDEMGLGKTATSIAAMDACRAERVLIVCPAVVVQMWKDQIEMWSTIGGRVQTITSSSAPLDFGARWVIVTYGCMAGRNFCWTARDVHEVQSIRTALTDQVLSVKEDTADKSCEVVVRDPTAGTPTFASSDRAKHWNEQVWKWCRLRRDAESLAAEFHVIFDEAHKVKNAESRRTAYGKRLAQNAAGVLMVTGTPGLNDAVDGVSLLSFIDERAAAVCSNSFYSEKRDLKQGFAVKMIRRLKKAVAPNLLPKQMQVVKVDPQQSIWFDRYMKALEEGKQAYQASMEVSQGELKARVELDRYLRVARKLLGLAKVASGTPTNLIESIVRQHGNCVVFAIHHDVSDMLMKQLKSRELSAVLVDGRSSRDNQEKRIRLFQSREVQVLVAGIHANGEGVSFTAARSAVIVEFDWAPGVMAQAQARLHRIGQAKQTKFYFLTASFPGYNIDLKLLDDLRKKGLRIEKVLGEVGTLTGSSGRLWG